jgi:hypothetical protein
MSSTKNITDLIQERRILKHVLFWLAILLYAISKNLIDHEGNLMLTLSKSICIFIPQVIASYYISYFVIDKLVSKKKYFLSIIFLIIGSYFFLALGRILIVKIAEPLFRVPPFEQETILQIFYEVKYLFLFYLPSIYYTVFMFLFVKYFMNYKAVKENELKYQSEKVASELKTLKAQLNPHFLFNTLNNIYVLSLENSPQTPRSIEKLSKILDHVLYRCNTKFVSLESEIELLENYIDLEKLRYDDRLQVSFEKHIESKGEIAPLILLSLVENAFKHGAGEDDGNPKIDISIYNSEKEFKFVVSNTIANTIKGSDKNAIGLKNVTKQLELIYPNSFILDINTEKNLFTVTVTINK